MSEIITDSDGNPLAKISVSRKETVPTAQYANVQVGPITVERWVKEEDVPAEIEATQEVVEEIVATERNRIYEQIG